MALEDTYQEKVDIQISEDHDTHMVFINLKSDPPKEYLEDETQAILENNGIVFRNNQEWIGTSKSFISIGVPDENSIISLENIFKTYGNLETHNYQLDDSYYIFAINKKLLKDYYEQIKNKMKIEHESEHPDIYLSICSSFSKTEIHNIPPEDIDKYLYINEEDLYQKAPDLELTIPYELTSIILKKKKQQTLDEFQHQKLTLLHKNLQNVISEKKEDSQIIIRLELSENNFSTININTLMKILI